MGNRAVITVRNQQIGVYLHWNGGRDSVEAFLTYCKLRGFRSPEKDNYGWARLCQVIGNYFNGGTSVGIDRYLDLDADNGDNGVYIIEDWKIVDRLYFEGKEQQEYSLLDMLQDINEAQPERQKLSNEIIKNYVREQMEV